MVKNDEDGRLPGLKSAAISSDRQSKSRRGDATGLEFGWRNGAVLRTSDVRFSGAIQPCQAGPARLGGGVIQDTDRPC